MLLSRNFTLAEMTRSEDAERLGISNTPTPRDIAALRVLCEKVLQPLRDQYGAPVIITSGYRSPRLNRAIGGSITSQHCFGEAADFTVKGQANMAVCRWMERWLNYDQLILEFGNAGWIHCSYRPINRNQELSARLINGRTRYLPGLWA